MLKTRSYFRRPRHGQVELHHSGLSPRSCCRHRKVMASGPVVAFKAPMVGNVWITTTQELAGRVLKDSETFTLRKDGGGIAGLRWWMPGALRALADNMLTIDEPDHTRLRKIVDKAFHRRAILDMEPRIRAIADKLAGELFADGSPVDLVDRYARKLAFRHLGATRPAARRQAEVHNLGKRRRTRHRPGRLHAHDRRPCRAETLSGRALKGRAQAWRRGPDRGACPRRKGKQAYQRRRDGGDGLPDDRCGVGKHNTSDHRIGLRARQKTHAA